MKKSLMIAATAMALLFSSNVAHAAKPVNVLVIDAGVDMEHSMIKPQARANQAELHGKPGVDDDNNGYVDDIYGWNFMENSNTLIHLGDAPDRYDKAIKNMEDLAKFQQDAKFFEDETSWEQFQKLAFEGNFKNFISTFAGWAHGTHVAGIIARNNKAVALNTIAYMPKDASPNGIRVPTIVAVLYLLRQQFGSSHSEKVKLTDEMINNQFGQMYFDSKRELSPMAKYMKALNPKLVNCSFGTSNEMLDPLIKEVMEYWGRKTDDKSVAKMRNRFVKDVLCKRDKFLFDSCPDALFFIAAGNTGKDIDDQVISPNSVDMENKLVVAATDNNEKLADFSSYGKNSVDIACPGVNIKSAYPDNKVGKMSGTSMAAPVALRYASQVLATNPNLSAIQLKKILMGTVDKKPWLKGKVKSGGVINVSRAVHAAYEMKSGTSLEDAIKTANLAFDDKKPVKRNGVSTERPDLTDETNKELYFLNAF